VIARQRPDRTQERLDALDEMADKMDKAIGDAVAAARSTVDAAVRRWTQAGGPQAVAASVVVAGSAAQVAASHVRAAAAALGLRRPADSDDGKGSA
jgi:hypothetical protein